MFDPKAHILNHSSLMSVKLPQKPPSYLAAFTFPSTLAKIRHPLHVTSLKTLTLSQKRSISFLPSKVYFILFIS